MPTPIIMPKFEMAQETGTVSKWLKQEGDPVEKGEPILEVETDKINMEVESPASGILGGISAGPGTVVPIGQAIAYILKPGETLPQAGAPASSAPIEAAAPLPTDHPAERATPVAERLAQAHGLDVQALPRSSGRLTKADVESFLATQESQTFEVSKTSKVSPDKPKAVPAARRLAHQLGVDLAAVSGSGPAGRIQSADVQQAAQQRAAAPAPAAPLGPIPTAEAGQPAIRRTVPLTTMRRTIAERLTAAARDIPQFTVSLAVEMSRAQQIVDEARTIPDGPRVTLTALLVKACAWTLARHPAVNASFNQDSIVEWAEINIGVAAAVEAGLIVPVICQADRLNLGEISMQLNDLGARAREGKLRPEELRGGTFTISNLGMFGVEHFTAIINPPQAAILAVGRIAKRPIVTEDEQIVVKPMSDLTLTADHRVIDGAKAAQFLADLKHVLEHPGALV
ncbi:MAG: 2-oxo acid dehydrogenase subunit E2 [Anaerolineales bacterium]|nr:2-oxo acid dehydrogenase subunit E2 [Anaerolineales bacterium]